MKNQNADVANVHECQDDLQKFGFNLPPSIAVKTCRQELNDKIKINDAVGANDGMFDKKAALDFCDDAAALLDINASVLEISLSHMIRAAKEAQSVEKTNSSIEHSLPSIR